MSNDVERFFNDIRDNYDKIAKQVQKQVSKKVDRAIQKEQKTCLKQYYRWKPDMYDRTGALSGLASPIMEVIDNGYRVGFEYIPGNIAGKHLSNSKKHQSGDKWVSVVGKSFAEVGDGHGIPDYNWIFDNFMEGKHPNGRGKGRGAGFISDKESVETHMSKFVDEDLPKIIPDYVDEALIKAIYKYL